MIEGTLAPGESGSYAADRPHQTAVMGKVGDRMLWAKNSRSFYGNIVH